MAVLVEVDTMNTIQVGFEKIDKELSRYPYCIVWTPIPGLTWFLPFIGHMGICTSTGVIRDFAGSYFVSEDNMAFGKPTKYWKLDKDKLYSGGFSAWDTAVHDASEEYKHRMHNLCYDNCHSHVATALNLMRYDNSISWNMVNLCLLFFIHSKHVSLAVCRRFIFVHSGKGLKLLKFKVGPVRSQSRWEQNTKD
ncbi:transmembrane protein 222a isoform X2 [Electrophorus electricus]|uniref:transmembrane protein 222a isoform X2 n=1 Tax=Electrophorus electricus TaxID=8005 RepID=UPI000F0A2B63|nr:transmembrane protein 222a isoform X2 [Electrophorus electricus]